MKLAKKVLMGALSGAMIFQYVPMASAEKGDMSVRTEKSDAVGSCYDANAFRVQFNEMLKLVKNCFEIIGNVKSESPCREDMENYFFANITTLFSHMFDEIFKPVLRDSCESYGEKPLALGCENFVPTFLRDSSKSFDKKKEGFYAFAGSLEHRLRGRGHLKRSMQIYAESQPKFFKRTQKCLDHSRRFLLGLRDELFTLNSANATKSSDGEVSLVTFPTIKVTGPEYEKGYSVSDSESSSESDSFEESGESGSESDSSEEASETEQNDAEQPAANEGEEVATEKRDSLIARILRFISFGKLCKSKK